MDSDVPKKSPSDVTTRRDRAPAGRTLDDFSDLLHRIYDAGLRPERWSEVVGAIAESLGASKALLFTPRLTPQHGGLVFPAGIDEKALQLWGSHFIDKDVWAHAAAAKGLFNEDHCWTDADLVPDRVFLDSSFYRDFLSGIDIRYLCFGTVFSEGPGMPMTAVSVFRGHGDPCFDRSDTGWLKRLIPHVSRSLGFMRRLELTRAQTAATRAAFDRLPFGVVLLGRDMTIAHMNTAAVEALGRGDGLAVDAEGMLAGAGVQRNSLGLAPWMRRLGAAGALEQPHFREGFSVMRTTAADGGQRQYFVQCFALPRLAGWGDAGEDISFAVFVTDPASLRPPSRERLVALFQLTPTQAEAALALARGASYKEVARELRVSLETVRSHVKEIYPKARVNRQADLVRLVLSLGQVAV